jgi:putative peptidoglycan lipid II flippase
VTVVGVAGCLVATWLLPRADIVVGIPLAYAAAYTAGLLAAAILRRRLGRIDGHRLLRTHARVAIAAGIAGSCGAVTAYALTPLIGSGFSAALITFAAAGATGTAVYVALARLGHP